MDFCKILAGMNKNNNFKYKGYVKSSYDLIGIIVKSVSLGGNLRTTFQNSGLIEKIRLAKEIRKEMSSRIKTVYTVSED